MSTQDDIKRWRELAREIDPLWPSNISAEQITKVSAALFEAADRCKELVAALGQEDISLVVIGAMAKFRRHLKLFELLKSTEADRASASAKMLQAQEALRKIYSYRSDKPDWNMVMAIAGDIIEPMEAVPSEKEGK